MPAPMVAVRIKEPLPGTGDLAVIPEVDPSATEVEIGTQAPGGYGSARVGMTLPDLDRPEVYPSLPRPYTMRDKAHVLIDVGGYRGHEGIMQRFSVAQDGCESLGYGLAAAEWAYIDAGGTHQGDSSAILPEAIAANPWWRVGQLDNPGVRRVWNDVRWQPVGSVIDSIIQEGSAVAPYTFLVYEGGKARVQSQAPPTRPHYHVSYDRSHMDLDWDVSQTIDAARMVYITPLGEEALTDPIPAPGVNLATDTHVRMRLLTGSSASGDLAQAFVTSYVAYYSKPILTGTISYTDWRGPDGVPGYRVRAGQWIKFGDYGMSMIQSTTSNISTGATDLQVGPPPMGSLAAILRRADRTALRSQRHLDPVTGTKAQPAMPYDLMGFIKQFAEAYFESERLNSLPKWRR